MSICLQRVEKDDLSVYVKTYKSTISLGEDKLVVKLSTSLKVVWEEQDILSSFNALSETCLDNQTYVEVTLKLDCFVDGIACDLIILQKTWIAWQKVNLDWSQVEPYVRLVNHCRPHSHFKNRVLKRKITDFAKLQNISYKFDAKILQGALCQNSKAAVCVCLYCSLEQVDRSPTEDFYVRQKDLLWPTVSQDELNRLKNCKLLNRAKMLGAWDLCLHSSHIGASFVNALHNL